VPTITGILTFALIMKESFMHNNCHVLNREFK